MTWDLKNLLHRLFHLFGFEIMLTKNIDSVLKERRSPSQKRISEIS